MAKQIQLRRGTTAETSAFTGVVGEVTVDTDKKTVVVHDGVTAGGVRLLNEEGLQAIIDTNIDWNTLDKTRSYSVLTTLGSNRPVVSWGTLSVDGFGSYCTQTYVADTSPPLTYTRIRSSGTWGAWEQLANTAEVNLKLNITSAFGVGQPWTNLTGSRTLGTTYTNSTGKAIYVSVRVGMTAGAGMTATVSGLQVCEGFAQNSATQAWAGFIVPNGSTYSVSASSLNTWSEMR